jgi:hypothetical protein
VTPFPLFLDRHSAVLVEMLKWPAGAPSTPGTPGWIMARFVMGGVAERRLVADRIGTSLRWSLNDAGRAEAESRKATSR